MRKSKILILAAITIVMGADSNAQTNAFGKVIWPLGASPGFLSKANSVNFSLAGTSWNPGGGGLGAPINRSYTTGSTKIVRIVKVGNTMNVTVDGSLQYAATNNVIAQITGFGFCSWEAGNAFWVDDFSVGNFTDNFSSTNSGNWTHSIEMEPVGPHSKVPSVITQAQWNACAQASYSRIQGGRLELRANTQSGMDFGKTYAKLNRPISGDFTMQFSFAKTQWAGHTQFIFTAGPSGGGGGAGGTGGRSFIQRIPASVVRIRSRFNPKTGQMQLVEPAHYLTHRGVFTVNSHTPFGHPKTRIVLRSQRTPRKR